MLKEKRPLPKDLKEEIADIQQRIVRSANRDGPGRVPGLGEILNHLIRGVPPKDGTPWALTIAGASEEEFEHLIQDSFLKASPVQGYTPRVKHSAVGNQKLSTIVPGKGAHLRTVMNNLKRDTIDPLTGGADLTQWPGFQAIAENVAAERR